MLAGQINYQSQNSFYSRSEAKHRFQKDISFGCRLLAIYSPDSSNKEEKARLIKSCIYGAPNSLRNQSTPSHLRRDGSPLKPFNYRDMLGIPAEGHVDGWGMLDFIKSKINHVFDMRSTSPAHKDDKYVKSADTIASENPDIVLAHSRAASDPRSVDNINNTHPFSYKNWAQIHNGFISIKQARKDPQIDSNFQRYEKEYGLKPAGTTDSEAFFTYFIGKMKDNKLDITSKDLTINDVRPVFAEALKDFLPYTKTSTAGINSEEAKMMGFEDITGDISVSTSMNFVTSNGKMLLAFARGNELYLGVSRSSSGKKEYIVASEIIDPADVKIKWLKIHPNHILAMYKDDAGNTHVDVEPIWKALAPKNRDNAKPDLNNPFLFYSS